ncbi:MAG: DUF3343 domain-containing protein [Oscillospiraceae bacterium]|nr:DUF3343 domain-containing protein [Oscillospiraceae bacterium]
MAYYHIVARSITQAQQMTKLLEKKGIGVKLARAKASLTGKGCGYTLRVPERRFVTAMQTLSQKGLRPQRVFFEDETGLREVIV